MLNFWFNKFVRLKNTVAFLQRLWRVKQWFSWPNWPTRKSRGKFISCKDSCWASTLPSNNRGAMFNVGLQEFLGYVQCGRIWEFLLIFGIFFVQFGSGNSTKLSIGQPQTIINISYTSIFGPVLKPLRMAFFWWYIIQVYFQQPSSFPPLGLFLASRMQLAAHCLHLRRMQSSFVGFGSIVRISWNLFFFGAVFGLQSWPGSMKVRFSVVSFAPPGVSLGVIGSSEALGQWSLAKCVALSPRLAETRLKSEPDFHSVARWWQLKYFWNFHP